MRIEHIAFNVENPVEVAQWYCDNLGMRVVRRTEESPYMHFLADSADQTVVEFYNNPLGAIPDYAAKHPVELHIAFLADNMEATVARLLEAGATAEGAINDLPNGDRLAFVRDPWGLTIQLVQRGEPLL